MLRERSAAANVYPSCWWASEAALDIMRVADAEPITRRVFEDQNCYRLTRAGGRCAEHEGMRAPLEVGSDPAGEVPLVSPGGPDDTRELVGEGDGGLVVASAVLKVERPEAQPIERRSFALSRSRRE